MTLLDLITGATREPAECVIRVGAGREEISDHYPLLTEVTVECDRQEACSATLRFESRRDETGLWRVQDDERIFPWQPILIEAVFGSTVEEVLRGYIREIDADYPQDPGAASVTIECQDESLALDREHVRKTWGGEAPTTDALIVTEIVAGHGLTPHPSNAAGRSNLVLHQNSTDVRFLRRRAEANAYELLFAAGQVYFGPPRLDAAAQATINVYAGLDTHCVRFSVRADAHQPDQVAFDLPAEVGAVNTRVTVEPDLPLLGPEAADSGSSGLKGFVWLLQRLGGADREELTAAAQRQANEAAMKLIAEGELDGSLYGHVLRVGEPVVVDGVAARLSGTYYVDHVSHRFDVRGYVQTFRLLRNAYGDNVASAASVLAGL